MCDSSIIMGNRTLYGSSDCLKFNGESFSAIMEGQQTNFSQFYLESADLGMCETYVGGRFASGDWFSESLAFRFAGLNARYNSRDNVIELTGADVFWPQHQGDLSTLTGKAQVFVEGPGTVLLPYDGPHAEHNVAVLNEIGQLCAALGW